MRDAVKILAIIFAVAGVGIGLYCFRRGPALVVRPAGSTGSPVVATAPRDVEPFRPQVEAFCGDCHATPRPESFPKEAWFHEVERGYGFYYASGRSDLRPPPLNNVVDFYRHLAPDRLEILRADRSPSKRRFTPQPVPTSVEHAVALSFLRPVNWDSQTPGQWLGTEMRSGEVLLWDRNLSSRTLARLDHLAHVEPCDLDGDGLLDLVVADLGTFLPEDHQKGRVVWLRRLPGSPAEVEVRVLKGGLGRVADVQPADMDGDGDLDLIVAEFGWQTTGRILLLENTAGMGSAPEFRQRELDARNGAIHVPVTDLNGDGRPDFVALISQEHETIVAFLNEGSLSFRPETIFAANDPSFGSSGIQLVDMDGDADLDVLYTNGDTLDSYYVKPYHGIQWLENRGSFPFRKHPVAAMPGVARALAGDLDGDGDLDIAAVAYLPTNIANRFDVSLLDSVLWMEQTAPNSWTRHGLQQGVFCNMALDIGDVNGDGLPDLLVGHFSGSAQVPPGALTVWKNSR